MSDHAYSIVRCEDDTPTGSGPDGQRCKRAPGHPLPHTCATSDWTATVAWPSSLAELPPTGRSG